MTNTETLAATRFVNRRIPATREREILKTNVYAFMAGANTTLIPLFPYDDPGAIVPCGATFHGKPGAKFGHFFHFNTADEIVLSFGASKAMIKTAQAYVTQRLHGVNSFLRSPEEPDAFLVLTVTQRQPEAAKQTEAVLFQCGNCHTELYRHDYSAAPPGGRDKLHGFITLTDSLAAVNGIADEDRRTCGKCGEVFEPFPLEAWGWQRWNDQLQTARASRRALEEHAAQFTSPGDPQ
jgi:hypothetical protein